MLCPIHASPAVSPGTIASARGRFCHGYRRSPAQRCADYTTSERLIVSETNASVNLTVGDDLCARLTGVASGRGGSQLTVKGQMIYAEIVELTPRGTKNHVPEDCDDGSTLTLRDEPSGMWQSGMRGRNDGGTADEGHRSGRMP